MEDGDLQRRFEAAMRQTIDAFAQLERSLAAASQALVAFTFVAKEPEDLDDDPLFAVFCNVLRRW
jgi:hypothetical protein